MRMMWRAWVSVTSVTRLFFFVNPFAINTPRYCKSWHSDIFRRCADDRSVKMFHPGVEKDMVEACVWGDGGGGDQGLAQWNVDFSVRRQTLTMRVIEPPKYSGIAHVKNEREKTWEYQLLHKVSPDILLTCDIIPTYADRFEWGCRSWANPLTGGATVGFKIWQRVPEQQQMDWAFRWPTSWEGKKTKQNHGLWYVESVLSWKRTKSKVGKKQCH